MFDEPTSPAVVATATFACDTMVFLIATPASELAVQRARGPVQQLVPTGLQQHGTARAAARRDQRATESLERSRPGWHRISTRAVRSPADRPARFAP